MVGFFRVAKVAVVAGVPAAPLRPFCDLVVNRAAVRPSGGASDGNEKQQGENQQESTNHPGNLVDPSGRPLHRDGKSILLGERPEQSGMPKRYSEEYGS